MATMLRLPCLRRLPTAAAVCRRSFATAAGSNEETDDEEPAATDRQTLLNEEVFAAEQHSFAKRINQEFTDMAWLDQALTHKSTREPLHNGRLAVLGQALARTYVAEALFFRMPNLPAVCCEEVVDNCAGLETLFRVGRQTGVLSAIRKRFVGKSPNGFKDEVYKSVVGGCVAAVIGAIYSDRGPQDARRFVHEHCMPNVTDDNMRDLITLDLMPRETLRDLCYRHSKEPATYRVLSETGVQTHEPTITVGVFIDGEMLGDGTAANQVLASKEAARAVLQKHYLQEVETAPLPSDGWEEDELVMNGKKETPLLTRPKARALAANYP